MTLTISRRTGGKYSWADGVIFMGGYHSILIDGYIGDTTRYVAVLFSCRLFLGNHFFLPKKKQTEQAHHYQITSLPTTLRFLPTTTLNCLPSLPFSPPNTPFLTPSANSSYAG